MVDDAGSVSAVSGAYRRWINWGVDILVGPYRSNLVRRAVSTMVKPVVRIRAYSMISAGPDEVVANIN